MREVCTENAVRASVLGYPVDLLNMDTALAKLENYIKEKKSCHVVTLNPEMIMQAGNNKELSDVLKNADIIVPDGIGIILTLRKLGITNIEQLPGIELAYNSIKISAEKGYSVGFLGASKEVVNSVAEEFKFLYPSLNILFVHDGYFNEGDEEEIIKELEASKPDILYVALGVPKQELWINKYKQRLNSTVMLGVGGSFDIWSHKIRRAPCIFRKFGLEWFYRLISQPSRFKRMFPTLPLFFVRVMLDSKYTRKEY